MKKTLKTLKTLQVLVALLILVSVSGCGNEGARPNGSTGNTVSGVLEEQMKKEDAGGAGTAASSKKKDASEKPKDGAKQADAASSGIDVDLTKLSSTVVYSEVYNMMTAPESYIGKTVKMNGKFSVYEATDDKGQLLPNGRYFACVIADATACCSQGLEFVLEGEHKYPGDYPSLGSEITVVGEFNTYIENGYRYCHLTGARMTK